YELLSQDLAVQTALAAGGDMLEVATPAFTREAAQRRHTVFARTQHLYRVATPELLIALRHGDPDTFARQGVTHENHASIRACHAMATMRYGPHVDDNRLGLVLFTHVRRYPVVSGSLML